MSGGGGYTNPEEDFMPCRQLNFRASVQSIRSEILQYVKVGDVLHLQLNDDGSIAVTVSEAAESVLGFIVNYARNLRECIRGGNTYAATVEVIDGGQVVVAISFAG